MESSLAKLVFTVCEKTYLVNLRKQLHKINSVALISLRNLNPHQIFILQTVFYELPRLSNISRDELVPVSILQERFANMKEIPLANPDKALNNCSVAAWVVKATGEIITFPFLFLGMQVWGPKPLK